MAPPSGINDVVDLTYSGSSAESSPSPVTAEKTWTTKTESPTRERLAERDGLDNVRRIVSPQSMRRNPNANGASITVSENTTSKFRRASNHSFSKEEIRQPSISQPSESASKSSPRFTTPPPTHLVRNQQTPKHQTPKTAEWSATKIETSLRNFSKDVHRDHARLVHYTLDTIGSQKPRERRHLSAFAPLEDLTAVEAVAGDQNTMKVKLKQHGREQQRGKQEQRQVSYRVNCITTNKERVPRYRFHHVEISKNILSPNTPLKFIPHLKDLQDGSGDTEKFNKWIEELESMDQKSGFDTTRRVDKAAKTRTAEYAALLSLYLERWIKRLGIDSCNKSTLIRYMASQSENDDAITPQQKSSLLNSYSEDVGSPKAVKVARMFTMAFNRVFSRRRVTLDDVLMLDESVENIVDTKKLSKDILGSQKAGDEHLLEQVQHYLGTYTILGCLICYSHSCEHGEFDAENIRRCFSSDNVGSKLARLVNQRRLLQAKEQQNQSSTPKKVSTQLCKNQCYRSYDVGNDAFVTRDWTENETNLLRSIFLTLGNSTIIPQCTTAVILNRKCWEVYRQMRKMNLVLPEVNVPDDVPLPRPVNWYDRVRKTLNGDWQDHTYTHEHALREQRDPCNHDGPCHTNKGCPCAEAKVLCERFCRCTVETCNLKFTGCACHASGKTCYARQKEGKPCICVQLNRECDPVLCQGCGARERADPQNAHDDVLHSIGCQNVALQRGLSKTVLLGKSQLEGCGYGLITAEDIAADEFVIEYLGELITHDEGVRREARRGDVFDQESNSSYLFTLLEQDGIWVDAAIYGNLSRYINHASEHDKRGCNITPKILYVNGEFRIKFTALRDIKAGEELFFNYGENFPNLTKKLLEDKGEITDGGTGTLPTGEKKKKRRSGRPPRDPNAKQVARKPGGNRRKQNGARKEAPPVRADSVDAFETEQYAAEDMAVFEKPKRGRKRKRNDDDEDDEADEWRPGAKESEDDDFGRRYRGGKSRRRGGLRKWPIINEEDSEGEVRTPVKKGRGGRRKKVLSPVPDNADSEEVLLMRSGSARGGRKSPKASGIEIDEDGDAVMAGHDYSAAHNGARFIADSDEDDDDVMDSSRRRKRQKPARYRADDE